MADTITQTPNANRLHIGVFGKRNSGKSSLINAFTGQNVSIVSDVAGTTTDPVYKAMEIYGIGPAVLIDTAGYDDIGPLGEIRVEKTRLAAERTDVAVILFSSEDMEQELNWVTYFKGKKTPFVPVVSKSDINKNAPALAALVEEKTGTPAVLLNAGDKAGVAALKERLIRSIPEEFDARSITGDLVEKGDLVLLVMPQDIQAPRGRLILPQVQTLRELLDKKALVMSCTTDQLDQTLAALSRAPKLIITDSQVFGTVYEKKPAESLLTSFSVLFAAYKGDLPYYIAGAKAIDRLTAQSKVLIAECCTHAPLAEDIGREKIPRLLRKRAGDSLQVKVVSGMDFPQDLSEYDLIIQCGACMFNRKYVMSRIERAKAQQVPMCNYGVTIAHLTGILDKISVTE